MADGEAYAAEEAAAGIHLGRCPACRLAGARLAVVDRLWWRDFAPRRADFTDAVLTALDAVLPESRAVPADRGVARPACVPPQVVVWCVGAGRCACAAECGCGCQHGEFCRCHARAA